MLKLREYQKESVEIGVKFLRENKNLKKRGVLIEPTGSGKSIITACIANQLEGGVLVFQPSIELLSQNYEKFKMYGGEASIFSASMNTKEVGRVTFATIGSLKGKQEQFSHVRHILIDECHLLKPIKDKDSAMFVDFIKGLGKVNVLGLTATPFRTKKFRDPFTQEVFSQVNLLNRMRPIFFNEFLHVTQIKTLYEQKYLCPIKYLQLAWDNGQLKLNTTGADFTQESLERAIVNQKIVETIPNMVSQAISKGRKHVLVFVSSVDDAEKLIHSIPDSAVVSSRTHKKERQRVIDEFKAGKIKTVINVGVLTTGFDFPALDTIIIGRPTMSLILYMQMIGRGIRQSAGKDDCVVLDMCGNFNRFGRIEDMVFKQSESGLWEMYSGDKLLSNTKMKIC